MWKFLVLALSWLAANAYPSSMICNKDYTVERAMNAVAAPGPDGVTIAFDTTNVAIINVRVEGMPSNKYGMLVHVNSGGALTGSGMASVTNCPASIYGGPNQAQYDRAATTYEFNWDVSGYRPGQTIKLVVLYGTGYGQLKYYAKEFVVPTTPPTTASPSTLSPSLSPSTLSPSLSPSTSSPSQSPTTGQPTSAAPSKSPVQPTLGPSVAPTSASPSSSPVTPTMFPSSVPTTMSPSKQPTDSKSPSQMPSALTLSPSVTITQPPSAESPDGDSEVNETTGQFNAQHLSKLAPRVLILIAACVAAM